MTSMLQNLDIGTALAGGFIRGALGHLCLSRMDRALTAVGEQ